MCHPAWGPARSAAPGPEGARELDRAGRLRDLIDREGARTVQAAHDGARRLPLEVAALAACSGLPREEVPCDSVVAPAFSAGL